MRSFFERHWWRMLCVLLACLLLVFVRRIPPDRLPTNPRVTQENCERIKPGMTLKQVEEILGPPSENWPNNEKIWTNRNEDMFYGFVVIFDKSGLVLGSKMTASSKVGR
jgi:hypothetical protein